MLTAVTADSRRLYIKVVTSCVAFSSHHVLTIKDNGYMLYSKLNYENYAKYYSTDMC